MVVYLLVAILYRTTTVIYSLNYVKLFCLLTIEYIASTQKTLTVLQRNMFNCNKICNELQYRFDLNFSDFQTDAKLAGLSWDTRQGGIIISPSLVVWSSAKLINGAYDQLYSIEVNNDEMIVEAITQKMVALHPRKWKHLAKATPNVHKQGVPVVAKYFFDIGKVYLRGSDYIAITKKTMKQYQFIVLKHPLEPLLSDYHEKCMPYHVSHEGSDFIVDNRSPFLTKRNYEVLFLNDEGNWYSFDHVVKNISVGIRADLHRQMQIESILED
jgi:hypothetical protein